ncbi:MAG TPA: hypothetical protein VFU59_10960 [Candidatus Eisenbacteria bacterium]|nr:hypothetical protein [Candidatus Eisenbacteria bacterium]
MNRLAVSVRAAAVAFAAAALLLAGASTARALVIEGRVVKGSDHTPVANQRVTLHVVRGNEEVPGATKSTGADGRVRFENIPDGNGLEFYMATEYAGAFYTEGPLHPGPDGAYRQEMTVFEVGKEIDKVEVSNHHIIIERKDDGLHVSEILIVDNAAPTAYLGIGANHAENAGMRLGLPASIKGFEPGMGGEEGTLITQGREMMSTRPIPPGQRPLSFSYHVPLSGRMDLSHRFYFPTRTFVVMIADPSLKLESKALTYAGSREQGGKKYEMYTGSNLETGNEVAIRVIGASFWSNPAIYPWLAVPFLVAGILVFARRMAGRAPHHAGGSPAPHPAPVADRTAPSGAPKAPRASGGAAAVVSRNGDDLAQTYAYLIAALDLGREKGEVSAESHELLRGNLKRRLELIVSDEPAPRGH